MKIELKHIVKKFEHEEIFRGINHIFETNSSTVLLGINGSGKSTLLQIIAGYVMPSKGNVIYSKQDGDIDPDDMFQYISFCAPYIELIEEMTLIEFLTYHFSFKKSTLGIQNIIDIIGLNASKDKYIEKFSSGMKQRVKLAQAIFAESPILLLDEPCSNLDVDGIQLYNTMIEQFAKNKTIVVASNDVVEYKFCQHKLSLIDFKQTASK